MNKCKNIMGFLIGVLLICTGCSNNTKDVDLSKIMLDMSNEVQMDDMIDLTAGDISDYYGIEKENIKQFSAKINNSGIKSDEIVLIEAKDSENAKDIKEKLDNRYQSKINENSSYNPTELAVVEKCKVEVKGNYVSMIVSPEVDKLNDIYNKSF